MQGEAQGGDIAPSYVNDEQRRTCILPLFRSSFDETSTAPSDEVSEE